MSKYENSNHLQSRALQCERGGRLLFDNVSFELKAGEALLVQGANGSGKTSLLRILTGLNPAIEGEVLWNAASISDDEQAYQQELLFIGHQAAIKQELSVRENLRLHYSLNNCAADSMVELAEQVGLRQRLGVICSRLSAGQQRRVSLARLFLSDQALWILDEPLTALDVDFIAVVEARIQAHLARGGMLILTTHRSLDLGSAKVRILNLDNRLTK